MAEVGKPPNAEKPKSNNPFQPPGEVESGGDEVAGDEETTNNGHPSENLQR